MTLGDAPSVVLIVGLVFLVLATIALIGQRYGEAFPADKTVTVINETVTQADLTAGATLSQASQCEAQSFVITEVYNGTTTIVEPGNYTVNDVGQFANTSSDYYDTWNVSYTMAHAGTACNITGDLQTNISDNTSIAGIVLTISLVGIVLTVLIGVFLGVRRTRV